MSKELEFLEEKHGDNSWGHYPPSKREVAQWLQEWTEKQFAIHSVSKSFAVGVEVEITDCIKGHEFEIGEKVTIVEYNENWWICRNKKGIEWYINEDEANVC